MLYNDTAMLIEMVIIPTFLTGVTVGVIAAFMYFQSQRFRDFLTGPQP